MRRELDEKYRVRIKCGARVGDEIYMSPIHLNGLLKYDLKAGKLDYLFPFENEMVSHSVHNSSFVYGNEVWFTPQNGEYIAIYDTLTGIVEYIKAQYKKKYTAILDGLPTISYFCEKCSDDMAYILPAAVDAINVIDLKTKQVKAIFGVLEDGEYISAGAFHDDVIYAFTGDGKYRIDIDIKNISIRRYGGYGKTIKDIKLINEEKDFVIVTTDGVYIVDESEFINGTELNANKKILSTNNEIGIVHKYKDSIYLCPWNSQFFYKMDMHSKQVNKVNEHFKENVYFTPINSNQGIFGVTESHPFLFKVDGKSEEVMEIPLELSFQEIFEKVIEADIKLHNVFWGGEFSIINENNISVESFIRYICNRRIV